jgi:HD domain
VTPRPARPPAAPGVPGALLTVAARAGDHTCLVERAYAFAKACHEGQHRRSGDPYITHPVAVALILAEREASPQVLCAALLHDVVDDTPCTLAQLSQEFGPEIADLVHQVGQLDRLRCESAADLVSRARSARDRQVLSIKVADRLHNMRTLGYLRPDKQERKSREALEFFVPLARTLGMKDIEREFMELAAAVLAGPGTVPVPGVAAARIRPPALSRRLLATTLVLLPAPARERWLEEWTGELTVLDTRRRRARFTLQVLAGMPRLAATLWQPGTAAPPESSA